MYPKEHTRKMLNHVKPLHLIRLRGGNQHAKHPPKSVEDEKPWPSTLTRESCGLTTHFFKPPQMRRVFFFRQKYDAKKILPSENHFLQTSQFLGFGVLGAVRPSTSSPAPQMPAAYVFLGGGNSNIFLFSPRKLGKMNPFWLIFFKWVGSTTN